MPEKQESLPPAPPQEERQPLTDLVPLQCGVVLEVAAPDSESERLMAMGVCAGRMVELVQQGDPLILKVYGTRIGVSARLAERVLVHVCEKHICALDPNLLPEES